MKEETMKMNRNIIVSVLLACILVLPSIGYAQLSIEVTEATNNINPQRETPYKVFLCNNGQDAIKLSPMMVYTPKYELTGGNNLAVMWSLPSDLLQTIRIGSKDYYLALGDFQAMELRNNEAVELQSVAQRIDWWKSLPSNGTISFAFEISEPIGVRLGVWHGKVISKPFIVKDGRIIDINAP